MFSLAKYSLFIYGNATEGLEWMLGRLVLIMTDEVGVSFLGSEWVFLGSVLLRGVKFGGSGVFGWSAVEGGLVEVGLYRSSIGRKWALASVLVFAVVFDVEAVDLPGLYGLLGEHLLALVLDDLRHGVGFAAADVAQIHCFFLFAEHLIVYIGHKPQDPQPVVSQLIGSLNLMEMLSDLAELVLLLHFIGDHVVEHCQLLLEFDVDLVVEVGAVVAADAVLVLEELHLLPDAVDLLNYLLNVVFVVFDLLLLPALYVGCDFFQFLRAHLLVLLGLAGLVLPEVVLLHLLQQFGVLCLGDLFVPDAHVGVVGGDPAHGHVGHIEEGDFAFVDLEFLLLEEVEVEQLSVLLAVVALQVQVFVFFELHLAFFLHYVLHQPSRGRADIPEVVNRQRIIAPDNGVVHVFNICLFGLRLYVVGEPAELLVELSNPFDFVQIFEFAEFADLIFDGEVAEERVVLVLVVVVVGVEVLGYFVEVVFALLRQLDIGVLVCGLSLLGHHLLAPCSLLLDALFLLLESGRRLRVLEVKLMAVVPGLDLVIERLRPIFIVIDISGDAVDFVYELLAAISLNVNLIAIDDRIVEVILAARLLLEDDFLLVADELVVVLLGVLLVIGVEVGDGHKFFEAVDLAELVYVLKSGLVSHQFKLQPTSSFQCFPDLLLQLAEGICPHEGHLVLHEIWDGAVHVDVPDIGDPGRVFVDLLEDVACAVREGPDHVLIDGNGVFAAAVAQVDLVAFAVEGEHHHHLAVRHEGKALHDELNDLETRALVEQFGLEHPISHLLHVERVREEVGKSVNGQFDDSLGLGDHSIRSLHLEYIDRFFIDVLPLLKCLQLLQILEEVGGDCLQVSVTGAFLHILFINLLWPAKLSDLRSFQVHNKTRSENLCIEKCRSNKGICWQIHH